MGGYAAIGVFRKHLSKNAKQSKYAAVVKTAEDLEREALGEAEIKADNEDDEEQPMAVS